MKLLTINIGAAAIGRAEAILRWLVKRDDDVIVLTEVSAGAGSRFLFERFRAAGWNVESRVDDVDRGVAILSRLVNVRSKSDVITASIPSRIAAITFESTRGPITVTGLYIPSRDASVAKVEKKRNFLESIAASIFDVEGTSILAGDYNVVPRDHEPKLPGFIEFEYGFMDRIQSEAYVDVARLLRGGAHDHTWFGRTGDKYCYDYVHLRTASLKDVLDGATSSHLHETRSLGLTDHSAIEVNIPSLQIQRLRVGEVTVSDQESLF